MIKMEIDKIRKWLKHSLSVDCPYICDNSDIRLTVNRGVFSPQHFPDWDLFLKGLKNVKGKKILEIGCGHGGISIHLAKYGAIVTATDICQNAILNTKLNAKLNELDINVKYSDIYSHISEKFDMIIWNIPFIYMPEDYVFQFDEEKTIIDPGYKLLERLLKETPQHLKENGKLILGTGTLRDNIKFQALLDKYKYSTRIIIEGNSGYGNPQLLELFKSQNSVV